MTERPHDNFSTADAAHAEVRTTAASAPTGIGPLAGLRVVEFASIGPGPHCAMLLSDFGAEVLRIDRPGGNGWPNPIVDRGRYVTEIDIRTEAGRETALQLCDMADVIVEGNRPGVMERLGFGPDVLLARNPGLIYGRMTGWGQSGPASRVAGHDINYIALTGALAAITDDEGRPIPPLNLVGDFGGGSLYLALGILVAALERVRSGKGQVVDAAILDGTASLLALSGGFLVTGAYSLDPDDNFLGGRAPFYRCYECADGRYMAVGAVEPDFYAKLLQTIGAPADMLARQYDRATWRNDRRALADIFFGKTRDDWVALVDGSDTCCTPVLTYAESRHHPQMAARNIYQDIDGVAQVAPAPRFSRTPAQINLNGDGEVLRTRWAEKQSA